MKQHLLVAYIVLVFFTACNQRASEENMTIWKEEIMNIEKEFNDMAQKEGLTEAFYRYAAPNGVIKRGKKVIEGNEAIKQWYKKDVRPNESLTWKPSFVDVSSSGDMAYTYGSYLFTSTDSIGTKKESTGIFHTVWKRQNDGQWRFVWD